MSSMAVRIWATRMGYSSEATRMGSGDMRLRQIDAGAREAASGAGALEAGPKPASEVSEEGHDAGRGRGEVRA